MKFIILLPLFITLNAAQRPSYAGSGTRNKIGVAERFKTSTEASSSIITTTLANRFGSADLTTKKIPVDARGDQELVDTLNMWPREHRPFWLLNADQIEKHRNQTPNTPTLSDRNNIRPVQENNYDVYPTEGQFINRPNLDPIYPAQNQFVNRQENQRFGRRYWDK